MKTLHLAIVACGVLLLGFLIYKIGPSVLWHELKLLGWGLAPIILLEGMSNLFHTQGWRHCLSSSHRSLPFARVLSVLLAGGSINYLTPFAGLGGEVAKGALLASNRTGAQAASAVILDKLFCAIAQLIFVAAGCLALLSKLEMPRALWLGLVCATIVLGCGIFGFLLVQIYGKLGSLVRWAASHGLGGKRAAKAALSMTEVDGELQRFFRTRPLDALLSVSWHFVGTIWGVIPTLCFLALTVGPSLPTAGSIVVLGTWFDLVAFALPVDIGVQETTRVLAFRIVGFSSGLGLAYGAARRLQQLFWAGIGLALYGLVGSLRRPAPSFGPDLPRTNPGAG